MSCRGFLLLNIWLWVAVPVGAQTNLFSFTGNDGKFYSRIKVIRVDAEGILYTYTQSAGGGRLKYSDLPEEITAQLQTLKPREKTFADTVPAPAAGSNAEIEAASSNRAGNGDKSDAATLGLTNHTSRVVCTFSRKLSTNEINYLIQVSFYGTNYLGLGVADSLTFDADGVLVTYTPVADTHQVDTSGGRITETQVYNSSLRDLQKICQAQTLGLALSGPLGSESFAIPTANILKNFGHYCLTNAPAATAIARAQAVKPDLATASVSYQSPPSDFAQVLEANAKPMDEDSYTTQWAWKVKLQARATPPKDFMLEFQFLDADGYVLAHEIQYPVKLAANETDTLTGQTAIKTALSARIKTCKVVMK